MDESGLAMLTVAYHSQAALSLLSEDLKRQTFQPFKWLVVNNSPESAPPIRLEISCAVSIIDGQEGDGFGVGCNRGMAWLDRLGWKGWVWLINPDTSLPDPETIKNLREELTAFPKKSIVGTVVVDTQGNLEPSAGWINYGLNFRKHYLQNNHLMSAGGSPICVDWVSGCSLLLKPSTFPSRPTFERLLPLYYEDIDLCIRLARQGSEIFLLPSVHIIHKRSEGSEVSTFRRSRLSSCSYIRFLQRHFSLWVLILRSLRLILLALIRLPLTPNRSIALMQGFLEALREPIS